MEQESLFSRCYIAVFQLCVASFGFVLISKLDESILIFDILLKPVAGLVFGLNLGIGIVTFLECIKVKINEYYKK